MVWALLIMIATVTLLMALSESGQLPWARRLHREHAGSAHKAEWMAPEDILQQVEYDYLAAHQWLGESALQSWRLQAMQASSWLAGDYLKQHQKLIAQYQVMRVPCYVGIHRAVHAVEVRQFSDDGASCYIIDRQSQCRMATYDYHNQTRILTQDMGDTAVVYRMIYDKNDRRWKIESYIQELPSGWGNQSLKAWVAIVSELPPKTGRDN
ncbi:MAG: hypothetical protein D6737_01640 [Chloroflexi bacterium]|nr:MAG: hypothetical protein CUN54_04895 [Phototrophicales bacterium]RMF82500.1 MAG: hypothetical protein D6737_01640 [Chloroflexota bacterium]